jgi:hypothetical protein
MPRPALKKNKTRLNLELSEDARARLEKLQQATDADSLGEVIRRALALYDVVHTELDAGGKLLLKRKGEDPSELRII